LSTESATILFTDQVGSTELSQRLSAEAADEVRRGHFSILRQVIAESGGTEVKNLGDGLMVVFGSASAALACAVAMQQGVERDNREREHLVGLRVGLSGGEVSRENDDYFGDPVVEAARLCATCGSGQILATDIVRAMAGRRSSRTFSSLGGLELKGLSEPIETVDVGWEPLGAGAPTIGRVPLPTRLGHRPIVGLIGREDELATLGSAAKRVSSGEGREVVLISGEPGQGKSTLVSELAGQCHETGMTVLLGRCDEEVGAPYRPFAEALSHYVAHVQVEVLQTHVAAHGGELVRLVPALHQRLGELPALQGTDADTERYLLYAAVVDLLEQASAQAPVVLVLDDLHWADKPSLQLLRHLVANTSAARLLVLGTYRDAELSSSHPLSEALATLHREPAGVSSIEIKGLDDSGVIAFMESAAGHELDDAGVNLAHDLYRETDGNPFFVAELLRHLSESGAIYQDATTGRWTTADHEGRLALPHSVRTVIGTRVSRLGDQATKALSTASIIGRDFDLNLLSAATSMDEDDLIDLLEEAQRAAVVQEVLGSPGRYSFSHALIQHTLYEDLGETRRSRIHRTVGEAIERLYGGATDVRIGELARHFLLATSPTDAEKAVSYARRAGEAALSALAPDDAVRLFTQALELSSQSRILEPRARIDLLIALGTAQRQAGISDFRATLLDAAHQAKDLGDADRLAKAALANSRGFFSWLGQLDVERIDVLEAALVAFPKLGSPERARLLATLCSELTYHSSLERRLALADEAKTIARGCGDASAFVDVINSCATALLAPSTVATQFEDVSEAMVAARDLDDPSALLRIAQVGYTIAVRLGQFDLANERLAIQRELAESLKQPARLWGATYYRASQAMVCGDIEEADGLATAALEIGTASGQPDASAFYGSQLM
jgi:class 3 adenylate cyclase/energy-coupling factor transporter ATP-binding protein EcfA2